MIRTITIVAALTATQAGADGLAELGLADPVVEAPTCRILWGLLPCHGIGSDHTGDDNDHNATLSSSDDPVGDFGVGDNPHGSGPVSGSGPDSVGGADDGPSSVKGNASANNKKGGNYSKTGHSDNGKGKGRNKGRQ